MSSVLPFEVIALIIDNVGEKNDTNLLKELALVSHSFHQICIKHLFATVELHDASPNGHRKSSKNGFIKLLESRPNVVNYIRKLTYKASGDNDLLLLSPNFPKSLRTISRLNFLEITASKLDWNRLDSSLTSALLYLMHLPTINHIDLSFIQNFPLSSLTLSVNLLRLDIYYLCRLNPHDEDPSEIVIQSGMMPKIREFHTSDSAVLTTKLLHAKRQQDGRPAFNFMDLRQLSMSLTQDKDEQNIRYLLQNATLLERLHLSIDSSRCLVGLRDILYPSARSLKVLGFDVCLYDESSALPLAGLCEELEAMAGHNILEALSFEVHVDGYETKDFIGTIIQNMEKVLVKPGWSTLRQVSFEVSIACCLVSRVTSAELCEALQSLPDKYLSHLSKLDSIDFNFSASVVKCAFEY